MWGDCGTGGAVRAAIVIWRTWRVRPASQRKRRLKGRDSAGFAGAALEEDRSHFRMFLCGPMAQVPAASSCASPSAFRRAGAKRKAAGPSPEGRDPGFIRARFTRDPGFGPEVDVRVSSIKDPVGIEANNNVSLVTRHQADFHRATGTQFGHQLPPRTLARTPCRIHHIGENIHGEVQVQK